MTEDGEDSEDIGRGNDAMILQLIRDNMDARGYTELTPGVDTDVPDVILVVRAQATRFYSVYSGCNWGGYWGGCGWWYPCGGYGCWYPVAGASYAYTTGTLFIDMAQPDGLDPDHGNHFSRAGRAS